MQITLSDIKNYHLVLMDINNINAEISAIRSSVPTTGRPSVGGHSSSPSNPTEQKAERIARLESRRAELVEYAAAIERYVRQIPDEIVKQCCIVHYIECKSWRKTSDVVFKSSSSSKAYCAVHDYFSAIGKEH